MERGCFSVFLNPSSQKSVIWIVHFACIFGWDLYVLYQNKRNGKKKLQDGNLTERLFSPKQSIENRNSNLTIKPFWAL